MKSIKTLVSKTKLDSLKFESQLEVGNYYVYSKSKVFEKGDLKLIIDGYIVPRKKYYSELSGKTPSELVFYLFNEHGLDFIKYLKGVFNIFFFKKMSGGLLLITFQ